MDIPRRPALFFLKGNRGGVDMRERGGGRRNCSQDIIHKRKIKEKEKM